MDLGAVSEPSEARNRGALPIKDTTARNTLRQVQENS